MLLTSTNEAYTAIEDVRQAMFGYRRDQAGEIIEASPMWDPGSREAKELMERARLEMFGYCRDQAGETVDTVEEAVNSGRETEPQTPQLPHRQVQSIVHDLSGLQQQADRVQRLMSRLQNAR